MWDFLICLWEFCVLGVRCGKLGKSLMIMMHAIYEILKSQNRRKVLFRNIQNHFSLQSTIISFIIIKIVNAEIE